MRTIGNVWGAAHQLHCLPGALPSMEWHQQANYHLQVALWLCKWGITAWNRTSTPYDWGYHLCHCRPQTSVSAVKLLLGPGVFSQWLNEPWPPMVWGGCARKKQEEMFLWPGDRDGKYRTILETSHLFWNDKQLWWLKGTDDPWSLPSSIHGYKTHLSIANPWSQNQGHDQGYIWIYYENTLWKHLKLCDTSHYPKKGADTPSPWRDFFVSKIKSHPIPPIYVMVSLRHPNVACHPKSLPTQVIPSSNHTPL